MDLSKHIETVRNGISNAAVLADENTQEVARRLGAAVDSSARLALLGAVTDAANEISAEMAPGSVEVRVADNNPHFSVQLPEPAGEPTLILPEQREQTEEAEPDETADEDESMVRVSLRLPASVKRKVDEAADDEGISTNAWLLKSIQNALSPSRQSRDRGLYIGPEGVYLPDQVFGSGGVFGPGGPFGPGGIFASSGKRGPRPPRPPRPPRAPRGVGNQVKGWVK